MTDLRIAGTHIVVRDNGGYFLPRNTSAPAGRAGQLVRCVDPRLTARDLEIIAEHQREVEFRARMLARQAHHDANAQPPF